MYKSWYEFKFAAVHSLEAYELPRVSKHEHIWEGCLIFEKDHLIPAGASTGTVMKLSEVEQVVRGPLHELEWSNLNILLNTHNPTEARVAQWLYEQLKPSLPGLVAVFVDQCCTCAAEYRPGN